MRLISCITLILSLVSATPAASQTDQVLQSEMRHLRQGDAPEWEEFAASDPDSVLVISFDAVANAAPAALEITHYDVRLPWRIVLNGADLGTLQIDELLMTVYRDVPAGTLKDGRNVLRIESEGSGIDDVEVGRIKLHDRPQNAVLSDARARVEVVDEESQRPLPSRITIVNEHEALQTVGSVSGPDDRQTVGTPDDHRAVRAGVIYAGEGAVEFGLPIGRYVIYASRGFEYGADSVHVRVEAGGESDHRLAIRREVDTEGWIAMDTHVHTLTHSGHGDATAKERVLTMAGEGIELPVITEHNKNIDLGAMVEAMGYGAYVKPIIGNEYTTPAGHFNVFPVGADDPLPDPDVTSWPAVASELGAIGPPDVVILNHARDTHMDFRPFGPKNYLSVVGRARDDAALPANAMEVVNSGAQQTDVMRLVRDWFGTLNAGRFLTPVGSSDSHDVTRYMVGQGRTYVRVQDDTPAGVDVSEAIRSLRDGQVVVSFGLMPTITVEGTHGPGALVPAAETVRIDARVLAPAWLEADRVALYMNGVEVRDAAIASAGRTGEKWSGAWTVDLPPHDVFLSVVALGPGDTPPFWPVAKPYQHESIEWVPHVIGISGAVWVDVDGDGRPTPARDYAQRLVDEAGGDLDELIRLLSSYDEAVAAHAASEMYARGQPSVEIDIESRLRDAPETVRRGFEAFVEALRL